MDLDHSMMSVSSLLGGVLNSFWNTSPGIKDRSAVPFDGIEVALR